MGTESHESGDVESGIAEKGSYGEDAEKRSCGKMQKSGVVGKQSCGKMEKRKSGVVGRELECKGKCSVTFRGGAFSGVVKYAEH
jgi:hypothetical protein